MVLNLPGDEKAMLLGVRGSSSRIREEVVFIKQPKAATIIVALDGTGDTDSIQEAINMVAKSGGTVFIKGGTYIITASTGLSLKANISLVGVGYATHIKNSGGAWILFADNINKLSFESIRFEMTDSGSFDGLVFDGCSGIHVYNCWFENGGGDCFDMVDCSNVIIMNCEIDNSGGRAVSFRAVGTATAEHLILTGNVITNSTLDDVELNSAAGGATVRHCTVTGNVIVGTLRLLATGTNDRNLVVGNFINGGVTDNGTNNVVASNIVT